MTNISPIIRQIGFRARSDSVGLNVNTWDKGAQNEDWSQNTGEVFRLRLLISDTVASTMSANRTFGLEFQINGTGGFTAISPTTAAQGSASAHFDDDALLTPSMLSGGQGSFVTGRGDTDGTAPNAGNIGLGGGTDHTEIESCLVIDSAQVSNGETIIIRASGTDATPTQQPTITVVAVEGPNEGSASGSIGWVGAADGAVGFEGSASGGISWEGSAAGEAPAAGGEPGYLLVDGTGAAAETVDKAQLDITGDIEFIVCVRADVWRTNAGHQRIVSKTTTGGGYTYVIRANGAPRIEWHTGSGFLNLTNTDLTLAVGSGGAGATNGEHLWLRATLDVDNGSSERVAHFYYSRDPIDTAPGSVTWTESSTSPNSAAGTTSIGTNSQALQVGTGQFTEHYAGEVFGVWVYDGIGGTLVAAPDFRTGAQGWASPPGADGLGNSWAFVDGATWVANEGAAPSGSASGSISWVGAADGSTTHQGSSNGSVSWVGAATGEAPTVGSAEGTSSGAISWIGSADGSASHEGSASGGIAWVGSATGQAPTVGGVDGSASGSIAWVGSADGTATHEGSSTGSIGWVGTADGVSNREGVSTGSITWSGSATGQAPVEGQNDGSATGIISWSGTALGESTHEGSATGSLSWDGSATGQAPSVGAAEGSASGSIAWTGTANGEAGFQGAAIGAVEWSGLATGMTTYRGSVLGAVDWMGAATGGSTPVPVGPEWPVSAVTEWELESPSEWVLTVGGDWPLGE